MTGITDCLSSGIKCLDKGAYGHEKVPIHFCFFWLGSLTLLSQAADFKDGAIGLSGKLSNDKNYILVSDIYLGSPADLAGLKHGDEIVKINGTNVNELSDLINYSKSLSDSTITFTVQRIGKPEPLIIKVPRLTIDLYTLNYHTEMELRSWCQIPVTLSEARMGTYNGYIPSRRLRLLFF